MKLPTPEEIKRELPLASPEKILKARKTATEILKRNDPRLVAIIGPCSVHDFDSAVEYAEKLKNLSKEIDQTLNDIHTNRCQFGANLFQR